MQFPLISFRKQKGSSPPPLLSLKTKGIFIFPKHFAKWGGGCSVLSLAHLISTERLNCLHCEYCVRWTKGAHTLWWCAVCYLFAGLCIVKRAVLPCVEAEYAVEIGRENVYVLDYGQKILCCFVLIVGMFLPGTYWCKEKCIDFFVK